MVGLILLVSISAFAQKKEYINGYVVNQKGDTIVGQLKKLSHISSCSLIKFIDEEGKNYEFSCNEVSAYERGGEIYRAKRYERPFAWLKDTIGFMKVLAEGPVNLYEFYRMVDPSETRNFVSSDSHEYYLERREVMVRVNIVGFRKQIHAYFAGNPEIQEKIWNREYRYYDLQDLVRTYNEWLKLK